MLTLSATSITICVVVLPLCHCYETSHINIIFYTHYITFVHCHHFYSYVNCYCLHPWHIWINYHYCIISTLTNLTFIFPTVGQLRSHVEHLERVNLALKEEIRVYEALHGLQITQDHLSDKSSSQNQTGQELAEENLITSSSKIRKSPEKSEEDLLRQYLVEIKKIRQRLERLDLVKDPGTYGLILKVAAA